MTADEQIVTAIAKQLPIKDIYADAIQPGAKQIGFLAEDLMKALRLALFPVALVAGFQDRVERFVKKGRIPGSCGPAHPACTSDYWTRS